MKYFIIAGETSGDLHGANLIEQLKHKDKQSEFRIVGGDAMQTASGEPPLLHTSQLAFMGFVEVLSNLGKISKNLKLVRRALLEHRPDVLILIDFPGFNLRIAEFAKKQQIPVCYYISPKIWAWNQKRVHKIKKVVDKMFCILPFEVEFYKEWGMEVEYVGNPLLDAISKHKPNPNFLKEKRIDRRPIIALLPGSREMEVKKLLPVMSKLKLRFPAHQLVVAGAPNLTHEFYREQMGDLDLPVVFHSTYDLLQHAEAAVVTSGTATLETALLNIPQVVVYKANPLTVSLARNLIKIKYISLVNLITDMLAVRELIQKDCTTDKIATELDLLINNSEYRDNILENYALLKRLVGEPGASEKTARGIVEFLKENNSGIE
ncbi:MAG TPA: lipid-A-disaccharide synthase [Sphingobacteriaceae bacterium]|nr:lipid-A-disaccharide synthase [Sphingobacteriaceae bacterium]